MGTQSKVRGFHCNYLYLKKCLSENTGQNEEITEEGGQPISTIFLLVFAPIKLQPWTNCVGKCLKTSNHDQKPTKTTSCTPFPLSMLENSKIQTSVTRKVLSQHCTGVGRGKMCGEQNFPTLMAKVVCTRVTPLTHFYLADFSETSSLQQSEAKYELGDKWWLRDGPMTS